MREDLLVAVDLVDLEDLMDSLKEIRVFENNKMFVRTTSPMGTAKNANTATSESMKQEPPIQYGIS